MTEYNNVRGATPVIGVILLVAIVIILSAVISVFVLGIGENLSDSSPAVSIDADQQGNSIVFKHMGGDTIRAANLDVSGAAWTLSSDTFSAGDRITAVPNTGTDEVTVTWAGETTSTILTTAVFDPPNLQLAPAVANTAANHTWEYEDLEYGEPGNNGDEIDTITVDYPAGTSFDGVDETDVTVTLTRTLSGGEDTDTISVNSKEYSGSSATFELSGSFQTDVAGPIIIEIAGIENPDAGEYTATITFNGDAGEVSLVEDFIVITA